MKRGAWVSGGVGLLVAILGAVALAGSGGSDGASRPSPPEDFRVDWTRHGAAVRFPGGWSVQACEGDGAFLCVARDGEPIGSVEVLAYPLATLENLGDAARSGDPEAVLAAFADRFVSDMREDRTSGCGSGYVVEGHAVRSGSVGGEPGIVYGFTGGTRGDVTERVTGYATVVDEHLVLVVAAAHDPGGCIVDDETLLFSTAALTEFEATLERIVAATPLPRTRLGLGPAPHVNEPVDGAVVTVDGGLGGGQIWFLWDGGRQRVQQPQAMFEDDLDELGLTVGAAVAGRLDASGDAGDSSFAVMPPDGPSAALYVRIGTELHRIVPLEVAAADVEHRRVIDDVVIDRLGLAR